MNTELFDYLKMRSLKGDKAALKILLDLVDEASKQPCNCKAEEKPMHADAVLSVLKKEGFIPAIKWYRNATGASLKYAKDEVEAIGAYFKIYDKMSAQWKLEK